MKGFLISQDGSFAFPLGPKVTTVGRENCDISINSPHVDNQHALVEYDNEQRCFILKDLNSSSGTYVHDCRVQNAAVRLADGDFLRFGFNGLLLEFRIEQQESSMPSIHSRPVASGGLHLINHTIPSRKSTMNPTNIPQTIDVRQNPGFSLRSRPSSEGTKKVGGIMSTSHTSNGIRDSTVRTNAWTITATANPGRSIINGSFSGEMEIPSPDNSEITNRVDQLEKEVKSRDTEIRQLTDRLRSLEPMNCTFTNEVQALRAELEKVKKEKHAASGLISSLQRDLHSKESNLVKLGREVDGLKTDSRDKDVQLQSLQGKLNLLRNRGRAEDDRFNKERELKIKIAEEQIVELTEGINRLKAQLQDTDKQLLRVNQNEQRLKDEYEQARGQLAELQQSEVKVKADLTTALKTHTEFCVNIWRLFARDEDDDEYDEDEHNIVEQIQQLQRQLKESREELERANNAHSTSNEQCKQAFGKLSDMLVNSMHEQTTLATVLRTREQLNEVEENAADDSLVGIVKRVASNALDSHAKLIAALNGLVLKRDGQQEDPAIHETVTLIRRQFEELEFEKQALLTTHISREQAIRAEMDQTTVDKDAHWQQRFTDECDRLRQQNAQLQSEFDEQTRSLNDRLEAAAAENKDHLQKWDLLQTESSQKIGDLTSRLEDCQRELSEEKERRAESLRMNERQKQELNQMEQQRAATTRDLNSQIEVCKDQVRQFCITIVQLEKSLAEEKEKCTRLQIDFDSLPRIETVHLAAPVAPVMETVMPAMPILTGSVVDISHELFAYKSRVQEQEQIIISLRRDLSGMAARLSDVHGELSEKQKHSLEKSELTVREQTQELNETRLKLSKLSDIVDKQSAQLDTIQSDFAKSKTLNSQYELLIDQRQKEIDRLTATLNQQSSLVEHVEKINQDEGRITHELVAIGAQCKGERHEATIGRQREALNELRARIKSVEQLRPANPSYEKALQQVVLLKRELAELRARQALPTDIPQLTGNGHPTLTYPQSAATLRHSPAGTISADQTQDTQKVLEERAAHAETINALQSYDDLHNTFTRALMQLLDIDDESLLHVTSIATLSLTERYVALQQRQRTTEILTQKVEMLRERLLRKEDLLRDYEKDLGKLRQAEILLRDRDMLVQDLATGKRSKDDEALFLRNTLKETQDQLNHEKRVHSATRPSRPVDPSQSNDLIRRSTPSAAAHQRGQHDATSRGQPVKRDANPKLVRKENDIKSLKQDLHEALDIVSEQSRQVKLLEQQAKEANYRNNSN